MNRRSERGAEGAALSIGFDVDLRPRTVARLLGATVAIVVGISVLLNVLLVQFDPPQWLQDLFRLDIKGNIPAFLSGLLFAISAGLFALAWQRDRRAGASKSAGWILVAFVMLVLSFEELFGVPADIGGYIRDFFRPLVGGQLGRLLPYAFLILVVGVFFWPLWRRLTSRAKALFAYAAGLYITGALLFPYAGRALSTGREGEVAYALFSTVEESLEMSGLVLLVYALLSMLEGMNIRLLPDAAEPLRETA